MAGKMVPIAHVVSRSEALVVASMLEAAGIIVRIGGEHHASVEVNSVALGHYPLTVPDWQHGDASGILRETFAGTEWRFSEGAQTAAIKLLLAKLGSFFAAALLGAAAPGSVPFAYYMFMSLGIVLATPTNPQGRADYYLSKPVG